MPPLPRVFSVTARSASSYSSSARVRWPGHGCSIPSWSLSLKSGPPRRSRGGHPCTATVVAGGPSATVSPSLCDLCVATSVSDSTSRLWLRPPLHIVRQSPSGCHHFRNLRVHGCVWTSDLMSSCLQFFISESPICVGVRCCRPSVLILTHVFSSCLTGSWRVWFVCRLFFASGSVFPVSLFFQFFLFVLFFMCVLVLHYFSLTLSLSIFFFVPLPFPDISHLRSSGSMREYLVHLCQSIHGATASFSSTALANPSTELLISPVFTAGATPVPSLGYGFRSTCQCALRGSSFDPVIRLFPSFSRRSSCFSIADSTQKHPRGL